MEFVIPSISCAGCAKSITQAIMRLDAAAKVSVNLETKQVNVTTNVDERQLKQMLSAIGFAPI